MALDDGTNLTEKNNPGDWETIMQANKHFSVSRTPGTLKLGPYICLTLFMYTFHLYFPGNLLIASPLAFY